MQKFFGVTASFHDMAPDILDMNTVPPNHDKLNAARDQELFYEGSVCATIL